MKYPECYTEAEHARAAARITADLEKHTMSKHTPNQWVACPGDAKQHYNIECKGDGNDCHPVAVCRGPDRAANARLIAAAPSLLAALESIARGLTNGQKERGETFQSIAREALALARQGGGE